MTAVREPSVSQEPALWSLVGNTPLVPVRFSGEGRGRLWLKAEWLNPGGSVKDRAARAILREGLARGELPGKRLLDASSGNTGIAYAMLGAAAGREGDDLPARQREPRALVAAPDLRRRGGGDRPAGRHRGRGAQGARAGRVGARDVLLCRPVQQHRQSQGAPGDDRPGDLGADRRSPDPFRRRDGNHGNHDGDRPLLEGEERRHHAWSGSSRIRRSTAWRG